MVEASRIGKKGYKMAKLNDFLLEIKADSAGPDVRMVGRVSAREVKR